MVRSVIIALILAFPLIAGAQTAADRYIEKYDSLAIMIMNEVQMPASVVLAIAIHESAAGQSKLCAQHHNHFGTKGRSVKTKKGVAIGYQHFDSDEASYEHFAQFIMSRKFYPQLKGDMSYARWVEALRRSGYAASPAWQKQVMAIIRKNTLTRFDVSLLP